MVYIASTLPKKGNSFEEHLESVDDFRWKPAREGLNVVGPFVLQINVAECPESLHDNFLLQDGVMALPPDFAAGMFHNDLETELSNYWTIPLRPQSVGYARFGFLNTVGNDKILTIFLGRFGLRSPTRLTETFRLLIS